jgi:hypothetical protein
MIKPLALNILDIVQNSIEAKASEISIEIFKSKSRDRLSLTVEDNGSSFKNELSECFSGKIVKSKRAGHASMELSMVEQHTNLVGGDLTIKPKAEAGKTVNATFPLSHLETHPLGDIAGIMTIFIAANPGINFHYIYKTDTGEFRFSSEETKELFEVDTLNDYSLLNKIGILLNDNLMRFLCMAEIEYTNKAS